MKTAFKILSFIFIFVSCKQTSEIITVKENKDVEVIERTVTEYVTLPQDSSIVKALFECDSVGNVLLSELSESEGLRLSQLSEFKNGCFSVKATDKAETEIITITKDSIVTVTIEKPIEIIRQADPSFFYNAKIFALGMAVMFILGILKKLIS